MTLSVARACCSRGCLALLAGLLTATVTAPATAAKISVSDDTFIDLKLLLQPWARLSYDPAAAKPQRELTKDFYLRRTRFILGGQLTRWVSFFVDTDMPNWGKGGDWSLTSATRDEAGAVTGIKENGGFFIQDAWVSFDVHESLHVAAGMLLLPFVHFAAQGAASLHTLDYPGGLLRYPTSGDKVWRSTGVGLRGLLWRRRVDYRLTVTNGVADNKVLVAAKTDDTTGAEIAPAVISKTHSAPRVTGRLAYNLFDAEDGFFLGGTYLGAKKIVSAGLAFDFQPQVFGARNHYYAVGGDIFVDYPLGPKRRISGQLAVLHYGGHANPQRGTGLYCDVGFAMGKLEPMIGIAHFSPGAAETLHDELLELHPGLAWWLFGHNANVKLDLGIVKPEGRPMGDANFVPTIQSQLLF